MTPDIIHVMLMHVFQRVHHVYIFRRVQRNSMANTVVFLIESRFLHVSFRAVHHCK